MGCSKWLWATLVGEGWKSCEWSEIGHSEWLWAAWVGKDWKSYESGEIGFSECFRATSLGKDWKSCESGEIVHSKWFWATLVGKDWKSCESAKISHSEWLWAALVGKNWKSAKWGGEKETEQNCPWVESSLTQILKTKIFWQPRGYMVLQSKVDWTKHECYIKYPCQTIRWLNWYSGHHKWPALPGGEEHNCSHCLTMLGSFPTTWMV